MRKILLKVLLLLCVFVTKSMASAKPTGDTAKIIHTLDGNINEWNIDRFETDKETKVRYAVDHDADNLYLAIKVPDQQVQMKMMMMGMKLYVDKKGKRKEGTGVEFPIKKESGQGGMPRGRRGGDGSEGSGEAPDPKAMRERMGASMIFLKTFGFDNQEDKLQIIAQPNGINIAFDWDAQNVLYIEYMIPLGLLGNTAELNGKPVGIGWKINGATMPSSTASATETGGRGGRGGGGGGGLGARGIQTPSASAAGDNDALFKDQYIWTKYNLTF